MAQARAVKYVCILWDPHGRWLIGMGRAQPMRGARPRCMPLERPTHVPHGGPMQGQRLRDGDGPPNGGLALGRAAGQLLPRVGTSSRPTEGTPWQRPLASALMRTYRAHSLPESVDVPTGFPDTCPNHTWAAS